MTEDEYLKELQKQYDDALGTVLGLLQTAIMLATNLQDDKALTNLQTCVAELFRRAFECRREGKRMAITDDESHETDDGDTLH